MSNREVFQKFANRQPAQGGSVRSERVSEGVVLYSYATPIAYFRDDAEKPVFTNRRFSTTTSKQQGQARAACDEYMMVDDHIFRLYAEKVGAHFSFAR